MRHICKVMNAKEKQAAAKQAGEQESAGVM